MDDRKTCHREINASDYDMMSLFPHNYWMGKLIMENIWLLISVIIAVALLIGLVLLRTLTDGNAEVRLTDAAIAIIPVIVFLIASGKITKLVVGPEGVTVEAASEAILGAAGGSVGDQVERIEPEPITAAGKGGIDSIPEYLNRGVQALTFEIGRRYVPDIMAKYFLELTASPQFKYMVLVENDGKFFGIMDARKLLSLTDQPSMDRSGRSVTWGKLREWIHVDPRAFKALPGFVPAEKSLHANETKRAALSRLQDEDREWLPVVDDSRKFAGIVDRSRLTAGLILDVADRLEGSRADNQ
ncbi:MAG: hypothetical protein HOM25_07050 [Rhodospirillaceae bacterium]|jgi:hypothetical protein|nr:hypothetical protein [Rhodospirillaceae bacterium]MBT5666671.1 hypothetical protein [Rhodospirillaceae bacterium]